MDRELYFRAKKMKKIVYPFFFATIAGADHDELPTVGKSERPSITPL